MRISTTDTLSTVHSEPRFRVIIFGSWADAWNQALGPSSEIWSDVANVVEVVSIPNPEVSVLPEKSDPETIDIVIPVMEEHILNTPTYGRSLKPSSQALQTLANKAIFSQFMQENGFSYLRSTPIFEDGEMLFPVVVKQVNLNGGHGVVCINSQAELSKLQTMDDWREIPTIIEPYIEDSEEYVTHLVAVHGSIVWNTTFKYRVTNGDLIRTFATPVDIEPIELPHTLLDHFEKIFSLLDFSGPANIDFKITDGQVHIMEINPRLGGSLMRERFRSLLAQAITTIVENAS